MNDKKKIYIPIIIVLAIAIVLFIVLLIFKNIDDKKNGKSNISSNYTNSNSMIYIDDKGSPRFIDNYDYTVESKDDLVDLLKDLADMYGFKNEPNKEFKLLNEYENNGIKYYKLQQQKDGVLVYGNQLIVSTKDGKVSSISGHYQKDIKISTYKSLKEDEIKTIINNRFKDAEIKVLDKYIYIDDDKEYLINAAEVTTNNGIYKVLVDVNNKEIVRISSEDNTVKENYTYTDKIYDIDINVDMVKDGNKYYLESLNHKFYVVDASDLEMNLIEGKKKHIINIIKYLIITGKYNNPMELSMNDNKLTSSNQKLSDDGIVIMQNFQKIYEFYEKLGRKSVDNNGLPVRIFAGAVNNDHVFKNDEEYNNACWNSAINGIIIGSVDGKSYGTCLDVMGHEFTHGVVSYTANFDGYGIPSALNESYADVLGSLIEDKNFTMGEDIETIRDMADPSKYAQPSVKDGEYYFPYDRSTYTEEWCKKVLEANEDYLTCVDYDDGGEHINDGVPNHAAYLSYTNGAFKDKIEMAQVYYNSLMYLSSNSYFEDSALALIKSAEELGLSEEKINIMRDAFIKTKMLDEKITRIEGRVIDESGNPIEGVEVRAAYKDNLNAAIITHTDKDGNYVFGKLPENDYVFTYSKGKYETKTVNYTINADKKLDDVKLKSIDNSNGVPEIVFIMDVSASMKETDPKDIRKKMISNVVSELDSKSKVALVTFAKTAIVNNDGINDSIDIKNIVTDVFNITNDDGNNENSGTNGRAGLTKALSLFTNNQNRKYIVFFTDGEDNRENADDLTYDEVIKQASEKGIRIISVGLGKDLSQDTLNKLANETNGKYFNANIARKLYDYTRKVFEEIE